MVTETFRGCTVSCTHCSRSEAKRWGSSARSQASCREQLREEGAGARRGGGGQRGTPTLRALLSRAVVTRAKGSQTPCPGETRRCSKGSRDCPRHPGRPRGALPGQRLPGRGVRALETHMLCRTHQPQWGSRDPRHSSHDAYCTQLSTGTRVTWQHGKLGVRPPRGSSPQPLPASPPHRSRVCVSCSHTRAGPPFQVAL